MKTPEEIFDEAIKAKGLNIVSVKDADLYEVGLDAIKQALTKTAVVRRSEQCVLHSTDWNGKCFKCGEQVFVREPK